MLFGTVLLGALSLFSLAPTRVCAVYTSSGQNNTDYEYDPFMSELAMRDIYSPKITIPDSSTTWVVGSKVKVTWCVDAFLWLSVIRSLTLMPIWRITRKGILMMHQNISQTPKARSYWAILKTERTSTLT